MASLKNQYYKLGEKASIFVDPATNVKILPGRIVEVVGNLNKSPKLRTAAQHGHIVRVEKEEYERFLENSKAPIEEQEAVVKSKKEKAPENEPENIKSFRKLSDAKRRQLILDEYELDDDEAKEIKGLKGEDLVNKYKELEASLDEDQEEAEAGGSEEDTEDEDES